MLIKDLLFENELLAPNGKPSNLSADHYKLVRSEPFKGWFGDWENDPKSASKILDNNGEPLLVYHVTDIERKTEYSPLSHGPIYFLFNQKDIEHAVEQGNEVTYRAFLNVKNPKGDTQAGLYTAGIKSNTIQQHVLDDGHDGIVGRSKDDGKVVLVFDQKQIWLIK